MQAQLTDGQELKPLSPKHQRFCEEFIIDNNASQAAIRAGYKPKNVKQIAYLLRKDPAVAAEIERLRENKLEELGVTSFSILRETAAIANSNILDYLPALGLEESGLKNLSREQGAAIREVQIDEFGEPDKHEPGVQGRQPEKPKLKRRITLKLAPKTPALELLGRHKSLWGEKVPTPPESAPGIAQYIGQQVNVTIRRVGD